MFGHFGIEWGLTTATDEEFAQLGWWVDWYKRNRDTICTGRLVRADLADRVYFKGVVAADKAIFSLSMLPPSPVRQASATVPGPRPRPTTASRSSIGSFSRPRTGRPRARRELVYAAWRAKIALSTGWLLPL